MEGTCTSRVLFFSTKEFLDNQLRCRNADNKCTGKHDRLITCADTFALFNKSAHGTLIDACVKRQDIIWRLFLPTKAQMIGFTPVISTSIKCIQLLSHTHKQTGAGSKPSTNSLKVFVDSPVCVTYPEEDEESGRLFKSPWPCTMHNYKTTKHLWSCFRISSLQGSGGVDLTGFHCHHSYSGHLQNKHINYAS